MVGAGGEGKFPREEEINTIAKKIKPVDRRSGE